MQACRLVHWLIRGLIATFQEPCETSRALETFMGFHTKAEGYVGPANPGYCDAASMISKGWNKVRDVFLCERYFMISVCVHTLCHKVMFFPSFPTVTFSHFLLCSPPPGIVSLGLCWLRVGRCPKPPNLCSLHAEAHLGAAQRHKLLQVGPHRHHLFFRRHLGGDGHQGLSAFNFSHFSNKRKHLQNSLWFWEHFAGT